jgi:hypothetical protein
MAAYSGVTIPGTRRRWLDRTCIDVNSSQKGEHVITTYLICQGIEHKLVAGVGIEQGQQRNVP